MRKIILLYMKAKKLSSYDDFPKHKSDSLEGTLVKSRTSYQHYCYSRGIMKFLLFQLPKRRNTTLYILNLKKLNYNLNILISNIWIYRICD